MTRLEQLRLDALLTPEQLGQMCKVSGRQIRRIEAGDVGRVRMSTLAKLSTHFAVPASELLGPVREAQPEDLVA